MRWTAGEESGLHFTTGFSTHGRLAYDDEMALCEPCTEMLESVDDALLMSAAGLT